MRSSGLDVSLGRSEAGRPASVVLLVHGEVAASGPSVVRADAMECGCWVHARGLWTPTGGEAKDKFPWRPVTVGAILYVGLH